MPTPTEKPLAKKEPEETALIVPEQGAEFDNMDREDFKLPVYRIVQATSRYAPPNSAGKYWNNVTQEVTDGMTAAVLRVAKTRILFPSEYAADSPILCASDDARHPRPQFVGTKVADFGMLSFPIPEECEGCMLSAWQPDGSPPPCSISYKYVIVDLEAGMPGVLSLKRTDVSTARALNTLLRSGGLRKLRLSSEFVQTDQGQWFAFRYNVLPGFTKEEAELVAGLAGIAKGAAVRADVDEEPPARPNDTQGNRDALFGAEEDDMPF